MKVQLAQLVFFMMRTFETWKINFKKLKNVVFFMGMGKKFNSI